VIIAYRVIVCHQLITAGCWTPCFVRDSMDRSCVRTFVCGGILQHVLWCTLSRLLLPTPSSTARCSSGCRTGCGLSDFHVYNPPASVIGWQHAGSTRTPPAAVCTI